MSSKNDEIDDDSRSGVAEHVSEVIDLVDTDSEDEAPPPIRRRVLRSSTRSLRKPAPAVAAAADIPRPRAVSDTSASIKKRTAAMSTSAESDDGSDTSRFSENASNVIDKAPAKKKAKKKKLPTRAARSTNKSTAEPPKKGRANLTNTKKQKRSTKSQLLTNESVAKSTKKQTKKGNTNYDAQGSALPFDQNPKPLKIVIDIKQDFYIRKFVPEEQLRVRKIEPNDKVQLERVYDGYSLFCCKFQKKDVKFGAHFHDKDDSK